MSERILKNVRLLCAVVCAMCLAGNVWAQSVDSQLSRLIGAGQYKTAQTLLDANNPSIEDKLFFVGRVLKSQRQFDKAVAIFREILIRDPGYVNARRELAHTLLLAQQFDVAEFHFEQLLRDDPSPKMQSAYRQFLTVIAQNKPYGVSGSLSFTPSSNVNRGTTYRQFIDEFGNAQISEDSIARSGIGLQVGLYGFFRKTLSPKSRLTFNWSLQGVKYSDEQFDSATASVSATYQRNMEWGNWTITPFVRNSWTHEELNDDRLSFSTSSTSVGVGYGFQRRLSKKNLLAFYVSGEKRDYPRTTTQDGNFYYSTLNFTRQLRSDLAINVGTQMERSDTNAGELAYDGVKLTSGVTKSWNNGLRTGVSVNIGKRDFDKNYFLRSYPRADDYWGVSVSFFNPRFEFKGIAPQLTCSHTRNRSNIEFFVYSVEECRIALTRNF